MKLFQQLLVAGAALSFVAPMASQASVNLDDMKSYSNSSNSAGFSNDYLNIEPGDFIHQSINDLAASRGCSVDISDRSIFGGTPAKKIGEVVGEKDNLTLKYKNKKD